MKQDTSPAPWPTPVKTDSRSCFAIEWYATEAEAVYVGARAATNGEHYNGGFYDGMPCGRETVWDREVDGVKLYAATRQ